MRWTASDNVDPAPNARRPVEVAWPDLHICPRCDRTFVVPRAVLDVVGGDRYVVELACSNCGWSTVSTEGEERLEALDREMDRQVADMREALELAELTRRMEEIDAFATALHAELILPEDF
jgi:hypothetical protein